MTTEAVTDVPIGAMPEFPKLAPDKRARIAALWPKLTLDEKQKLARALVAEHNYPLTHPIECYVPQDKPHWQKEFHRAPHKIRAMFGGNQSGKTYCGKFEAAFHFTGVYPDWYPVEGRMKQPTRGRILVKDFPKGVGEVMEPALASAIPERLIKGVKRNSQGYLTKMYGTNGSTIDIVTHDMDTKALEGWQGHWLWPDEPPSRDKWIACMRGLIKNAGRCWFTCTPLDEPWMYDEVYLNPEFFSCNVDIDDNKYLSKKEIDIFAGMLNEDEKEARLHGKFMHMSGLTHKEFSVDVHVKDSLPEDARNWPRWQIVDPHTRKPFAVIYGAIDPLGRKWIYDEWPRDKFHTMRNSAMTPVDYKHLFRDLEENTNIYRRIMDGRFCKQPMGAGGDSLLEIFDDLGIHYEPSYITHTLGTTDPGYLKTKDALRVSLITNEPDLFILRKCQNVIYAFQHNTWENYRDETKGIKETQSQFAKDFLDVIRYWLMDDPAYFVDEGVVNTHGRSKWVQEMQNGSEDFQGSYGAQRDY